MRGDSVARRNGPPEWPPRCRRLAGGPRFEALPAGWELYLDGGHNPGAAEVLARQLALWRDRPLHLIYGMLTTKDAAGFLAPLAPFAADLHAVAIAGETHTMSAETAAQAARAAGIKAEAANSPGDALSKIIARARAPSRILICGSLYLAGQVLRENG
mgnify:CR=1 FL=1